jgi:hypothetical protein
MYRFYPKGHLAASRNHESRSVSFSFRLPFVQPVEIRMSEFIGFKGRPRAVN